VSFNRLQNVRRAPSCPRDRVGARRNLQVKIEKLAFMPSQVSAHVGDTIEWVNADFIAHTATARDGAWDVMIAPSTTASVVLKAGGTVDYYCRLHPNMTGQINVK
jgi:plastocyanin